MDYATNSTTSPDSVGISSSSAVPLKTTSRPRRPCDACRKRKSRCEIQEGEIICVLCKFHHQPCLFNENPQPRKRRKISESGVAAVPGPSESTVQNVTTPNALPL